MTDPDFEPFDSEAARDSGDELAEIEHRIDELAERPDEPAGILPEDVTAFEHVELAPVRPAATLLMVNAYTEDDVTRQRETWLIGQSNDGSARFRMDTGTGLGHSHLMLLVEINGRRIEQFIDVAELAENWVNDIVDAYVTESQRGTLDYIDLAPEFGDLLRFDDLDEDEQREIEHTDRMAELDIIDREQEGN